MVMKQSYIWTLSLLPHLYEIPTSDKNQVGIKGQTGKVLESYNLTEGALTDGDEAVAHLDSPTIFASGQFLNSSLLRITMFWGEILQRRQSIGVSG